MREYVIHWVSLKTGATGHGTASYPYEEAKRYADAMNEKDKDIRLIHYVELVEETPKE